MKLNFLDHVISLDGRQPIAKRVKDFMDLNLPECKSDVMKIRGCLGFYSFYIKNFRFDSQHFHDVIMDSTPFHRAEEHKKLFQSFKDWISEDTILALHSNE